METLQLKAAMAVGGLLIDRKATKLVIKASDSSRASLSCPANLTSLADAILQAARIKFTKTEYISCPGCGRTMFKLEDTIRKVKEGIAKAESAHRSSSVTDNPFSGLKIAVMGCIVNGPGEMADADYGYVGAGRDRISLYRGKECILKNIPQEEAVEKLLELIEQDKQL
jgi:(E)-4-hydroxy-3-methylbut-2-enyl-diphosphate synthase